MARSRSPDTQASRSAVKPSVVYAYDPCGGKSTTKKICRTPKPGMATCVTGR